MFCALLIVWFLLVTNFQLGWNSELAATLPYMCIVGFALVHIEAACMVVIYKRGTTITKV